jgi:hypothetical protein
MPPDPNFDLPRSTGDDFSWTRQALDLPPAAEPPAVKNSGSTNGQPTAPVAASKAPASIVGAEPIPVMPARWSPTPPAHTGFSAKFRKANGVLGGIIQKFTLPEDAGPADPFGKLVTSTPPWLISLIVHFSLMIGMGLLVLGANAVVKEDEGQYVEMDLSERRDNEKWAETIGEQLDDPSIKMTTEGLEPSKDAVAAIPNADLPHVDDPLIGPPVLNSSATGSLASGTISTPMIGLEFSGREEGVKDAMLKAYGGTASTETAVKDGLGWLARNQRSRGSWSLSGPFKNGVQVDNDEAATAMALLAFQGAGYTPESSKNDPFTKVVTRGWAWLLRSEQEDGRFYANGTPETHQLYTQALCTIALCELYGMTHGEEYQAKAQKAVDFCVKTQSPLGGWKYNPGDNADLSVTGWFSMALQSARMAGLEVPSPVYGKLSKFLDAVSHDEGAKYAYMIGDGATLPITAEGLLCRQYLGWERDDERLQRGVQHILANLPSWDKRNVYYWYYATQVCHHMEGKDWQTWNNVMRQLLPDNQETKGSERGSWNPSGDRWGDAGGGRLYVTCLSLYTLEVYYRHLPIYRKTFAER